MLNQKMSNFNSQKSLTSRIVTLRNSSIPVNYFNTIRKPNGITLPVLVSKKEVWLKDLEKQFRIKKSISKPKNIAQTQQSQCLPQLHLSRSLRSEQIVPFLQQMNSIRRKSCEGDYFGNQSSKVQRMNQLCPLSHICYIKHQQVTSKLEKRRKALKLKTLVKFQNEISFSVQDSSNNISETFKRNSSESKAQKKAQQLELSKFAQAFIPGHKEQTSMRLINQKDDKVKKHTYVKSQFSMAKQESKNSPTIIQKQKDSKTNNQNTRSRSCHLPQQNKYQLLLFNDKLPSRKGSLSIKNLEWKINLILHTRYIKKIRQPSFDDFKLNYQDYETQDLEYNHEDHFQNPQMLGKTSVVDSDESSESETSNEGKLTHESYKLILGDTKKSLQIMKSSGKLRVNKTMSKFIQKSPTSVLKSSEIQSQKDISIITSQKKRTFITIQTQSQKNIIINRNYVQKELNISRNPTQDFTRTPVPFRKAFESGSEIYKASSFQNIRTKTSPGHGRTLQTKKSTFQ